MIFFRLVVMIRIPWKYLRSNERWLFQDEAEETIELTLDGVEIC